MRKYIHTARRLLPPLFCVLLIAFACALYAARVEAARAIEPMYTRDGAGGSTSGGAAGTSGTTSNGPAGTTAQPRQVPQPQPTPRPQPTPWNQLNMYATPTPVPTADPMVEKYIRENVEKVFGTDIPPTPGRASKNRQLSVSEAVTEALKAAEPSFRSLDITRLNIQKQIDTLRNSVNMAISALSADDRYRELLDAEELWEEKLEIELQFELEMYREMRYKELTLDERRELISVRDMGYERFNFNIKKLDYNKELMKAQITYAVYAQYAGIAKLQSAVAIAEEALELQKKNLEILKTKYELGAATRVETENAEISYNRALLEIRRQRRTLTSIVTGFNKLIGENLATTYKDFDRSKLAPAAKDKNSDDYIKNALIKRSEILIAAEEMSLTQRQAKLYESEISNFSTLDDKQDAIQAADEAEISYDLAVQDVESGVNDAYKQLITLRGATAYCESQIKSAQDNADRTQKLFELGMITAAGVDQARVSVSQAKMQLENNLIDIWLQQQKLEIICGIGPGRL